MIFIWDYMFSFSVISFFPLVMLTSWCEELRFWNTLKQCLSVRTHLNHIIDKAFCSTWSLWTELLPSKIKQVWSSLNKFPMSTESGIVLLSLTDEGLSDAWRLHWLLWIVILPWSHITQRRTYTHLVQRVKLITGTTCFHLSKIY